MEITEMQRKMDAACGHLVEVRLIGVEKPVAGKYINFTNPLDNDPEVASFDIAVPSEYHESGRRIAEITEVEIESITIKD